MKALIRIDTDNIKSVIEPAIFGSFVEHMGRNVYGGVYDPDHPTADENGFRGDVMEAVRGIHAPIIRYPGGNFVSRYNWKEGIGPKNLRPTRLDIAWKQKEPNLFGTDDFLKWCEKVGAEPLMTVNMGTGTPQDAGELVEYCNFEKGTTWSDERIKNGREKPYGVRRWCIGNEMDGPWQTGALSAEEYGRKAVETIKIMKGIDPDVKAVICGDSGFRYPTYPEWDRKVLEIAYWYADYISVHAFFDYNEKRDVMDFMASATGLGRYIDSIVATCDYVKAYKRSPKTMMISFDEWNVWHKSPEDMKGEKWSIGAARLENNYDFTDALAVASLLCTFINRSDRVKIACYAQLVNVIAPIFTETGGRMFRQTTYYPISLMAKAAAGKDAVNTYSDIPTYTSERYGESPYLHHAVCFDRQSNIVTVFAVNVADEETELCLDFYGKKAECVSHTALIGEPDWRNDFDNPEKVRPVSLDIDKVISDKHIVKIPKKSFAAIDYRIAE